MGLDNSLCTESEVVIVRPVSRAPAIDTYFNSFLAMNTN